MTSTAQPTTGGTRTMGQHTPEPWNTNSSVGGLDVEGKGQVIARTSTEDYLRNETERKEALKREDADAARIVACVNGCAGLNPAAYRECVEALRLAQQLTIKVADQTGNADVAMLAQTIESALTHAQQEG